VIAIDSTQVGQAIARARLALDTWPPAGVPRVCRRAGPLPVRTPGPLTLGPRLAPLTARLPVGGL